MSDQIYHAPMVRRAAPNFRVIAMIVASAMLMENVDATVLATALPTMARDFGVDAPAMSIALTSYLLSLAIFIPASGRMADSFGSRTVFRSAIAVFVVGSILCAFAPTLPLLVLARLLQGIGGAMMMPVGRLVLMRSVDRKDMVSAMSWLLVPALIGPIVGPPLGGFIVTYLDWRWIFYINVPIGIIGMIFVSIYIDEVKGKAAGPFDTIGFILSGISLGSLLFGFELSSHEGQGSLAIFLIATGLLFGIAYLRHARRHPAPIMDFSLMKVPSFGTSVIAGSLTRITQGAQPFLLPLLFQIGFGLSAAAAGQIVISTALGALFMKPLAKAFFRRVGFRKSLIINGILGTIGYGLCAAFRPDWPMPLIFIALVLSAFFMSFQFTAYNTIAYDEIGQDRMSSATSFYTTFQQLMLSLGICIGALALHGSMAFNGVETPELGDFSTAFIIVALISICATFWNLRFSPTAGEEISGYRSKQTKGAAAGS
ncbi:EmrB/QacA subfamily drug resistance transporter [Rhizobium sp. BK275]|uniref:DHA2 family efflux MFS transporter permease subunit n=1 Tax=unclassified Rhizobium TaxID=2613769 RepID=UPI001614D543|nr:MULTISPECIES: DHA2 family efflux MFS transporter permease subunit [unclassified Rhizobium]MBB3392607.1 EmrB/QacA subfamily drug resistance transporter [Rhizobium sp. BK275]MBB3408849.1 EmrB/QacA subfamily drug resistance transporter [Rhizobium sp. BK316]